MTLQQFILILWARRKIVVSIFAATVLLTLIVSLLLPKQYTASATVVLDVKSPDPIAGMVLPGLMAPGYMATQVDIINSDRVAQRVVKLLHMDESPVIQEQWRNDTGGKGDLVVWLASLLQKKLEIKPARESNVIEIKFSGADSGFSAAVANAFAQSYIDTNIDLRVEPAKQYSAWFERQVKVQRERLERAQKALSDAQQSSGIVATDERLDFENQKLNELSAQLTVAQAQGADAASKQKLIGAGADTVKEVIENPLINNLKADVARLESKLKELSGNLGENHPQYKRSEAELAELKTRLKAETAKITVSIATANRVSDAKEVDIKNAIEVQKKKILDVRKQRDEISVLLRDVDNAQRAFEAIGQRMTQSNLEAQSIQSNVSILTPASPPIDPSKPRVFLNTFISIFVGLLFAIAIAIFLELGQRRIRSSEDLQETLDLPVLIELDSSKTTSVQRNWRFWEKKAATNDIAKLGNTVEKGV
jgi:polysaccharide biosynthesis transport protein